MKSLLLALPLLAAPVHAQQSALSRAASGLTLDTEARVIASSDQTPFWLTANRHGLSSVDGQNGLLRLTLQRDSRLDSLHRWRIGYGFDLAVGYGQQRAVVLQQAYADFDYRLVRLTIGAKERPMELKNQRLSSGSQTFGINARPIPQVQFSIPEYWNISGRANIAAIKGYIGYGMMTDGRYLRDYVVMQPTGQLPAHYSRRTLYHAKAGYLRLGNAERFPLTFEGGLEMATTFGGTIYNAQTWNGVSSEPIHMGHSFSDFVDATFGVGGDVTDGDGYANATGNTVGSWTFRLGYQGPKGWSAALYYDHFFEDHSQMFFQYGWLDGLFGLEIGLPENPVLRTLVYEYMRTDYQSGAVYHDATSAVPDQISGLDNYYNHNLYAGWQHWGQAIGNPLYLSPLYDGDGNLTFRSNRFRAHNFGLAGSPVKGLDYRLLYTHQKSFGTYSQPFTSARRQSSLLVEAIYSPERLGRRDRTSDAIGRGWQFGLAVGIDRGSLLGNQWGAELTLRKHFCLTPVSH